LKNRTKYEIIFITGLLMLFFVIYMSFLPHHELVNLIEAITFTEYSSANFQAIAIILGVGGVVLMIGSAQHIEKD
jgi:hypothetical protein